MLLLWECQVARITRGLTLTSLPLLVLEQVLRKDGNAADAAVATWVDINTVSTPLFALRVLTILFCITVPQH